MYLCMFVIVLIAFLKIPLNHFALDLSTRIQETGFVLWDNLKSLKVFNKLTHFHLLTEIICTCYSVKLFCTLFTNSHDLLSQLILLRS